MVPSDRAMRTGQRRRPEERQTVWSRLVLGLSEQTDFCLQHGAAGGSVREGAAALWVPAVFLAHGDVL